MYLTLTCLLLEKFNSKLIYVSTDYVFDGKLPPYSEEALPNPLNKYGQTKYEGEKVVMDANPGNLYCNLQLLKYQKD